MYFYTKDQLSSEKKEAGFIAAVSFSADDIWHETDKFLEYKLKYKNKIPVQYRNKKYLICAVDVAFESILFGLKDA